MFTFLGYNIYVNIYLIIILTALAGRYLLDIISDYLNISSIREDLPSEFDGWYDAEKYRKSQEYLRERTRFGLFEDTFQTALTLGFILIGGFNLVDKAARSITSGPISTGLIFAGILIMASNVTGIPFSAYSTFVIEEKYGFNRMTIKTFILDLIKSLIITIVIGIPVFALIIWFFGFAGSLAWLYCWVTMSAFMAFMIFIAPYVIMPLFNKYEPLEDGELKSAIESYAEKQGFRMKGVYKMDGSRRSSKSNAFFTGFGKSRRIVLFDTLIQKHTVEELVAILAHEMGHYKKLHVYTAMVRTALVSGLSFFILSFFINNPGLFEAFRMEHLSIYASLFFFGFLFAPISMITSVAENMISRRHEFEADAFSVKTMKNGNAMISALKKLSVDNLSNLTPHPFKVFISYSHPPVLDRIKTIRQIIPADQNQ